MKTPSKFLKFTCVIASGLLANACSVGGITLFADSEPGQDLAIGESAVVHFFTSAPNLDTSVRLQSGASYQVDFTLLSNWIDGSIEENEESNPLNERGFDNSVMPWQWLGATRRSREHNWFELMLYQPDCKRSSMRGISELSVDEDSGSYNFVATCDGKLTLFVNDTRGFYSNNVGYANISLSRIN